MNRIIRFFFLPASILLIPITAKSQSTMEFQPGTQIEVTSGADICADNVLINGTYSGSGTQCGGPLPVEIICFAVTADRSDAKLNWRTATEVNNLGFEIERRVADGLQSTTPLYPPSRGDREVTWDKIGFVDGNGTTNAPQEYSFIDKNLPAGKYSYRLKQIDRDGRFEYSSTIEVEIASVPKTFFLEQNYPNPFNPATTIGFTLQTHGFTTLKIYDAIGREVATLINESLEAGVYHQKTFDAGNLAGGIYFARLQSDGISGIRKLLLTK